MDKKYKVAFLTSQLIGDQVPIFRKLSERDEIDLKVYFCWDIGVSKPGLEKEFNIKIQCDRALLDGYKHKFLKNCSLRPSTSFFGIINWEIVSELFKNKYDAIIVHGYCRFTDWLAFCSAFLTGTPVFLRGESPLNQELMKSRKKLFIKKLVLRPLFKKISAFLYFGEENKNFYKYYGVPDKKLFFVPYAIDNDKLIQLAEKLRPEKEKLKKKLLNNGNVGPVMLSVAKLIEKKHPMDLILAYESLIADNQLPDTTALVFIGDGVLRSELENYVSRQGLKNVYFTGFKNMSELLLFYAIADVFVLPSDVGETWGIVVNEAMCFNLPVVVSNVVGCGPDLVKDKGTGSIFPLGNIEKLASSIKDMILNKRTNRPLEVVGQYSYEKDVEGILSAIKEKCHVRTE